LSSISSEESYGGSNEVADGDGTGGFDIFDGFDGADGANDDDDEEEDTEDFDLVDSSDDTVSLLDDDDDDEEEDTEEKEGEEEYKRDRDFTAAQKRDNCPLSGGIGGSPFAALLAFLFSRARVYPWDNEIQNRQSG